MINSLINNIVENNINQLFSINQYNKLKIHFLFFSRWNILPALKLYILFNIISSIS